MDISTIISLGISIISIIFCIMTFVRNGNKDVKKDSSDTSYRQGIIDTQLKNISEKLDKIEKKLDTYDIETDKKIDKALEQHIETWHKNHG